MKRIAIYGAGAVGREILVLIKQINLIQNEWNILGFYDDFKSRGDKIHDIEVIGSMDDLNSLEEETYIVVAIGDCLPKQKTIQRITNPKILFPNLIHPSVQIEDFQNIQLRNGVIITAGNILTCDIQIGNHVLINLDCTVGHDVIIDDYCSIMPGCHISGFVKIGSRVYLGSGVNLIRSISITDDVIVGAGAVVLENIDEPCTVVGVPAKILIKNQF